MYKNIVLFEISCKEKKVELGVGPTEIGLGFFHACNCACAVMELVSGHASCWSSYLCSDMLKANDMVSEGVVSTYWCFPFIINSLKV